MKCVLLLLVAVLALVAANLSTPQETRSTLLNIVREVNSNPASTWKAALNPRFKNSTLATIKKSLGARHMEHTGIPQMKYNVKIGDLPTSFDSMRNWPLCEFVVPDQSACGSCWAVSSVSALTDRLCIASQGHYNIQLSSRDMVSCCTSCGDGCEGGWPSAAMQYFVQKGLPTGGAYGNYTYCAAYPMQPCGHHSETPYPSCDTLDYSTPSCEKSCDSESTWPIPFAKDRIFGSQAYNVNGEANMMKELMTNGPFAVAFDVYSDFLTYKSGVYKHTSGSYLGGHAVTLVGWGEENGVKFWNVRNNWNKYWAEQGHFRIIRGVNHVGIENSGAAATIRI